MTILENKYDTIETFDKLWAREKAKRPAPITIGTRFVSATPQTLTTSNSIDLLDPEFDTLNDFNKWWS